MKRLIFAVLVLLLVSCSKIDNTIGHNYYTEFQELKKSNPQYSTGDFNRAVEIASKLFLEASFSEDDPQGVTINATYKNLLDEAKQANKNDSIENVRYERQKNMMDKVVSLNIIDYTFTEDLFDDKNLDTRQPGINITISVKNNSAKEIKSIEGKINILNLQEKNLYTFDLSEEGKILPKSEYDFSDKYIVNVEKDNVMLKTSTIDSLKFEWIPSKIIFKDNKELNIR